ncbi:MAG TPA: amidohydrolase family protein [Polyangiales bacterium]|nr:amidohydrolase family protein [Polyangiales bacterium]
MKLENVQGLPRDVSCFLIKDVRVFTGEQVLDKASVVVRDGRIVSVGTDAPAGCATIEAEGGTLLPGLIDAHVHTSEEFLAIALKFGVTTELEMQGTFTKHDRAHVAENDTLADVRSSGFALTPPGGHPEELFPPDFSPGGPPPEEGGEGPMRVAPLVMPSVQTPEEAVAVIPQLVESGSDYIKFMVDDGSVEGHPGLPMLDQATLNAGVAEAHRHAMMAVAHALTIDNTRMALSAGIDGLAHLFMDRPATPQIIAEVAQSGAFVVACVVLDASMMGITGAELADDRRVSERLDQAWQDTLRSSYGHYPHGKLEDVLHALKALHDAGVDVLVGTDASYPLSFLGGIAHGASVHHELQYFVRAGFTPVEALRAATSLTARHFGLNDRGTVAPNMRADLLLVSGDPTTQIGDSLNIQGVWRRGKLLRQ